MADMCERIKLRGSSVTPSGLNVKAEVENGSATRNGRPSVPGELMIKSNSRLANLLPRPDVQWLQRACAELAAIHSEEGSGLQQCTVCKRMVFSFLLSDGQHKPQCIPADAPPTTGDDPRRRKARTASRQPSPVSPRLPARHVSPPSKRQKPTAVRPAQAGAKSSHLNASFTNRKVPKGATAAANSVPAVANVLPMSPPLHPVPHPSSLASKATRFRRRRTCRKPRTKALSFVPFDTSEFVRASVPQQNVPAQPQTAQQESNGNRAELPQSCAKGPASNGANWYPAEMRPASSRTSPPGSPHAHKLSPQQHPDTRAAPATGGTTAGYMSQQVHPSVAANPSQLQPSSAAVQNAAQWVQHAHQQAQQQTQQLQAPFMQAHPMYANSAAASLVCAPHGESSGCSQPHMHGVQQQHTASHRQGARQPAQQAQLRGQLPLSHADLAELFDTYLKTNKITRAQFSQDHRHAFKLLVQRVSARRLSALDCSGDQLQLQNAQQTAHTQHHHQQQLQQQLHQQQHLQYAVAMHQQNALGRGLQMHLRQAQNGMVPSATENSPSHSMHAVSVSRAPSCGALDIAMPSHIHGGSGLQRHISAAAGGISTTHSIGSPHPQHAAPPHNVHAAGRLHMQQPGMYPLGVQGHVMGHGEAMGHFGRLAVPAHHPDARWWTGT